MSANYIRGTLKSAGRTIVLGSGLPTDTLTTTLSATAPAADRTITFDDPLGNDSVVYVAAAQTLTNKTLTAPTLTTPALGVATATSINKVAITAPATGATLTVAEGKTLTASNTLTLSGTDGSSVAFGAGGTVAYTTAAQSLTNKLLEDNTTAFYRAGDSTKRFAFYAINCPAGTTTFTLPAAAGTLVTETGSATLTNKTLSLSAAPQFLAQTPARFYDSDSSHYVGLKAPATTTANLDWTLPSADGTVGQVLKTDGSGALGWVAALTNPATTGVVVDGTADENQLRVQGHSTQTSDILVVEKSDGTDLMQITNANGTHIRGTTTNDAAATGFVGEYVENNRTSASPAITSATTCSIDTGNATFNDGAETGITLTAGDWDISGSAYFITTGAVTMTGIDLFIGTAKGNSSTGQVTSKNYVGGAVVGTAGADIALATPTWRVSIGSTTTYYLKAYVVWSGGTSVTATGCIRARRMR